MNMTINEDFKMNGLLLVQMNYWHQLLKENYVKSHTFDPRSGSH